MRFTVFMIVINGVLALAFEGKTSTLIERRKMLLTKDNIMEHLKRQQKNLQGIQVPQPMTISTEIGFNQHERSPKVFHASRPALDGFDPFQNDLMRAEETQFVPSLGPEAVQPRNGKSYYDENVETGMYFDDNDSLAMESLDFDVPEQQEIENGLEEKHQVHGKPYFFIGSGGKHTSLDEINQHIQEARSSLGQENSVYYTDEEPDSLHGDRSPYNYEPADTQTQYNQNQPSHYIIKEHVYEMCPGCPTFNLQIPTQERDFNAQVYSRQPLMNSEPMVHIQKPFINEKPKSDNEMMVAENEEDNQMSGKGFFARAGEQLMSTMRNFGDFFNPKKVTGQPQQLVEPPVLIEEKADVGNSFNFPLAVAGAAAVALGGLALFGTPPNVKTISGSGDLQDVSGRSGRIIKQIQIASNKFK